MMWTPDVITERGMKMIVIEMVDERDHHISITARSGQRTATIKGIGDRNEVYPSMGRAVNAMKNRGYRSIRKYASSEDSDVD